VLENILSIYHKALPQDLVAGLAWYPEAHNQAKRLAAVASVSLQQAAYAIAALSPNTPWLDNVETSWAVARHHANGGSEADFHYKTRCLGLSVHKAFRILQGDLFALSGPKVTAFADNIMYPDASRKVTIDRWAYRIAIGTIEVTNVLKVNIRQKLYDQVAAEYIEAAERVGMLPLQLQAITWVIAHRLENRPI
jgi:hypothetical protein